MCPSQLETTTTTHQLQPGRAHHLRGSSLLRPQQPAVHKDIHNKHAAPATSKLNSTAPRHRHRATIRPLSAHSLRHIRYQHRLRPQPTDRHHHRHIRQHSIQTLYQHHHFHRRLTSTSSNLHNATHLHCLSISHQNPSQQQRQCHQHRGDKSTFATTQQRTGSPCLRQHPGAPTFTTKKDTTWPPTSTRYPTYATQLNTTFPTTGDSWKVGTDTCTATSSSPLPATNHRTTYTGHHYYRQHHAHQCWTQKIHRPYSKYPRYLHYNRPLALLHPSKYIHPRYEWNMWNHYATRPQKP